MRGGLRVTITPDDVGRRVSVRSAISAAPGEPSTTDAVGRLVAWNDGELHIQRRDGTVTAVPVDRLLAAKVIPEQPPRRSRS